MSETLCYCGSEKKFADCCEEILSGKTKAETPEELMRARYSAHASQSLDFLVDSVHPKYRKGVSVNGLEKWSPQIKWTGLEIHSTSITDSGEEGNVSFTAKFTINDAEEEMREDSVFEKYNGEWKYVDGQIHGTEPFVKESPRVGRNDPCVCGSGKKFKKCCDS